MKNRSVPTDIMVPHLRYRNLEEACQWLTRVFGFKERFRYGEPLSGIQISLGAAIIMLHAGSQDGAASGQCEFAMPSLTIILEDVSAHYERTRSTDAKIVEELHETVYGELQYAVEDLGGHRWIFSQHARDLSPEEWGATVARD